MLDVEKKIRSIIEDKPSESLCLDYKVRFYKEKRNNNGTVVREVELLKDVLAMLNVISDDDRFIIFGISDDKHAVGIDGFIDDNEIQAILEVVKPICVCASGTVGFDDKLYGYIHIPSSNKNKPYIVGIEKYGYSVGASFIRKGSSNVVLLPPDINRLVLESHKLGYGIDSNMSVKVGSSVMLRNEEYSDKSYTGQRSINLQYNDGLFSIGDGSYLFTLMMDRLRNNVARLYSDKGVCLSTNPIAFDFNTVTLSDILSLDLDFSNRVVEANCGDIHVGCNVFGKTIIIKFNRVEAKGCSTGDYIAGQSINDISWRILEND